MNIFRRISNLFKSNINAALDKAIDPAKEIDLLIEEMDDEARKANVELRNQLVQEKIFHKRAEEQYRNVQRWQEHATRAVKAGDDTLAREALMRQQESERRLEDAEKLLADQTQRVAQMTAQLHENQRKLSQIRARKETLKSQARQAKQSVSSSGTAFERFDQLVEKIELQDFQVQAMNELPALGQGAKDRETEQKMNRLLQGAPNDELEQRLRTLKASLGDGSTK